MAVNSKLKKACALFLAVVLCLPTSVVALAQQPLENPREAAVCICETPCDLELPNTDCPVCVMDAALCVPTDAAPEFIGERGETSAVCICETPCDRELPNTDCPVCATDAALCDPTDAAPEFIGERGDTSAVCICETPCDLELPNTDCPVCATDAALCQGESEQQAVCICDSICTETSIHIGCPVCAENVALCEGRASLWNSDALPKEAFVGEAPTVTAGAEPQMFLRSAAANTTIHSQKEIAAKWQELNGSSLLSHQVSYQENPVLTSASTLVAGELSQASQLNGLNYLNIARYIAGVGTASLDSSKSEYAQYASTYMAFGGTHYVDHHPEQIPGVSDDFYNKASTGTEKSNIAYLFGYNVNLATTIQMYLSDSDNNNILRLGHRRWLLYPGGQTFGFGLTQKGREVFSATYVQGGSYSTTQNVMWPAQQMPVQMFAGSDAWSLSLGSGFAGPSESSVSVTLTRQGDGATWTFSKNSSDGEFHVDYTANMFRGTRDAIIFRPDSISYSAGDIFDVKVEGLTGSATSYEYTVEFFDVNNPRLDPLETPMVSIAADSDNGGLTCTVTDTVNNEENVVSYTVEFYRGSTLVKTIAGVAAGSAVQVPLELEKIEAGISYTARVKAVAMTNADYSDSEFSAKCAAAVAAAEPIQTVTFNAGAGTLAEDSKTYSRKTGSLYGEFPVPTRSGYKFGGWFTEADGAGTQVTETTAVSADETRTLYAKWNEKAVPAVNLAAQAPTYLAEGNAFALRDAIPATGFTVTYRPAGSGEFTETLPVDAGNWDVKIERLEDDDYKAFERIINSGLSIGKADHDDASPAMEVRSNAAASVSFDLASIEGGLPAGYLFASPVYQENDDSLLTGTPSVSGTTLSFSVTAQAADATGTIQVAVTSTNYQIFDIFLTVTAVDKATIAIDVSGMSVANKTYDGAPALRSGTPVLVPSGKVNTADLIYAYTSTDGKGYTSATPPTDAGEYQLVVSVPVGNPDYIGTSSAIAFTISQRDISRTTIGEVDDSTAFRYNRTAHTPTITISDKQSGKELIALSDYALAYNDNVHAGVAKVVVTPVDTGNYSGSPVVRSFTIEPCPVSAKLKVPFSKTYDGNTGTGTLEFIVTDGVATGESLSSVTATGCVLTDANAANNIDIDTSGAVLTVTAGTDTKAGDYKVLLPDELTGAVTPKEVAAVITGPATAVYGAAFAHTASYSDLNGAPVTLNVLYDAAKTVPADVKGTRAAPASYVLTAEAATADGNYSITAFSGTESFTITPKALAVTQVPKTLRFNETAIQKILFSDMTDQTVSASGVSADPSALLADSSLRSSTDGVAFGLVAGLSAADAGKQITITVALTPASQNYQTAEGKIVVTISDKTAVDDKLSASLDTITYGDTPAQPQGSYAATAIGTPVWRYSYSGTRANGDPYGPVDVQPKHAGTYTVTATYQDDAAFGSCTAPFTILPKALEWDVSGLTALDKVYNGTDTATVVGTLKLSGVLPADVSSVTLSSYTLAARYADGLAAADKPITVQVQNRVINLGDAGTDYDIDQLDDPFSLTAGISIPTGPVRLGDDRIRLAVDTLEVAYPTYGPGIAGAYADASSVKAALKREAEKALSSVGDRITYYDIEVETSADGIAWSKTNGGAKILIPYPAGTSAKNTFAVVHMKDDGTLESLALTKGVYGVEFTTDSTSPFSLAWRAVKTSSSGSSGSNREDDEYDFWQSVRRKIENADDEQTIQVQAKRYDQMPWSVMQALYNNSKVSLEITWTGGEKIVIPAGAALKVEAGRIYYPLAYLEAHYENLASQQTGTNNSATDAGNIAVIAPDPTLEQPVTPQTDGLDQKVEEPDPESETIPDVPGTQEETAGPATDTAAEPKTQSSGILIAVIAAAAALAAAIVILTIQRRKTKK